MYIDSIFKKVKTIVFILNLLTCSNIYNITELMHLYLNTLTSKYGKRIVLIFLDPLYTSRKKSESSHFPFILSCLSFVSNATNFFIHSLYRLVFKKLCLRVVGFLQSDALLIPCVCKYTVRKFF